jgi:hypothetical protein
LFGAIPQCFLKHLPIWTGVDINFLAFIIRWTSNKFCAIFRIYRPIKGYFETNRLVSQCRYTWVSRRGVSTKSFWRFTTTLCARILSYSTCILVAVRRCFWTFYIFFNSFWSITNRYFLTCRADREQTQFILLRTCWCIVKPFLTQKCWCTMGKDLI